MRDLVLPDILNSFYYIFTSFSNMPKLVEKAMVALAPFIQWIDIGLVQNERFIPFFFVCLANQALKLPAAVCLLEVITKRMDPAKKYAQLNQLGIISVLRDQVNVILNSANISVRIDNKDNYADYIAKITASVGCSYLNIAEKLDDQASAQENESFNSILMSVVELNFKLFSNSDYLLAREVIPFISDYADLVFFLFFDSYMQLHKYSAKYNATSMLPTLLNLCVTQMTYRDFYNFTNKDDEEIDFDEFRSSVAVVIKV